MDTALFIFITSKPMLCDDQSPEQVSSISFNVAIRAERVRVIYVRNSNFTVDYLDALFVRFSASISTLLSRALIINK
jgi:hypothetical protein